MVVDPEVVVMGVEVVVMGVEVVVVPTMKWAVWVVKTLVTRTMAYHGAVNLKKWDCVGVYMRAHVARVDTGGVQSAARKLGPPLKALQRGR